MQTRALVAQTAALAGVLENLGGLVGVLTASADRVFSLQEQRLEIEQRREARELVQYVADHGGTAPKGVKAPPTKPRTASPFASATPPVEITITSTATTYTTQAAEGDAWGTPGPSSSQWTIDWR